MVTSPVAFLTPYWSGAEMMRMHLASIRQFHAHAPILVSKRGRDEGEMEAYRRDFGVQYWIEDCGYTNAYLRLLERCPARVACVLDHDTVLLTSIDSLVSRVADGHSDLVGIEERIRLPEQAVTAAPRAQGWLRYAPGRTASNFLVFDWQAFRSRFGLRGIFGTPQSDAQHFDFDYGISQRLTRHHYLRPYHSSRYGLGNLLKDGEMPVAWHQWYGAHRTRFAGGVDAQMQQIAEAGERAFLADYPRLELGNLGPAWGAESAAPAALHRGPGVMARARRELGYTVRALAARAVVALEG